MISHTALAEFRTTADVRIAYFRTDLFVSRSPRLGSQPLPSSCSDPSYRSSILKFCAVCRNSKVNVPGFESHPPLAQVRATHYHRPSKAEQVYRFPHVRYPRQATSSVRVKMHSRGRQGTRPKAGQQRGS